MRKTLVSIFSRALSNRSRERKSTGPGRTPDEFLETCREAVSRFYAFETVSERVDHSFERGNVAATLAEAFAHLDNAMSQGKSPAAWDDPATADLLEALEFMLSAQDQPLDHVDRRLSCEQARAAIARARGMS